MKAHLECPSHESAVKNSIAQQAEEAERDTQLTDAYNAQILEHQPNFNPGPALAAPQMFPDDPMDTDFPALFTPAPQLLEQLGQTSRESVPSRDEYLEQHAQEFERVFMEALQREKFGETEDSDELLIIDEDEDDDACCDLDVREQSDYFPYPNKTVSLTFLFIVHFSNIAAGHAPRCFGQSSTMPVHDRPAFVVASFCQAAWGRKRSQS